VLPDANCIFVQILKMKFEYTPEFARQLDNEDPLKHYREAFHFPQVEGKDVIYFTGNSLGLQPKRTQAYVDEIMADWKHLAVEGHFKADKPWWDYHERLAKPLAGVVGAKPGEITVMNTLTVNLHLLMVSFYNPTSDRFRILCEEKAFPSDQYMFQSQVRYHGLDPDKAIVELKKRPGEHAWHTEDVLAKIEELGDSLALVLFGGVNYYNGQVFDIKGQSQSGQQCFPYP
jgi:kynureninase